MYKIGSLTAPPVTGGNTKLGVAVRASFSISNFYIKLLISLVKLVHTTINAFLSFILCMKHKLECLLIIPMKYDLKRHLSLPNRSLEYRNIECKLDISIKLMKRQYWKCY